VPAWPRIQLAKQIPGLDVHQGQATCVELLDQCKQTRLDTRLCAALLGTIFKKITEDRTDEQLADVLAAVEELRLELRELREEIKPQAQIRGGFH
jgi:hypothetical protein